MSARPPRLLLFDVDQTLLVSGGAGRRAMDRAVEELYGVPDAFRGTRPAGKTDPAIFREMLDRAGVEVDDWNEAVRTIGDRYLQHLAEEVPRSTGARLMPGVEPLLRALHGRDDVALGLLTGNLEGGARLKLSRFGLNRFFAFGAFSSDDAQRPNLVKVAVARAEDHLGRPVGLGPHVVVIGDTPLDVACALANEVTAVGVASGSYPVDELETAGAHLVLPSLEPADEVVEKLLGK